MRTGGPMAARLFNGQDPAADCDLSGTLNLFDFVCFVNAFNDGC